MKSLKHRLLNLSLIIALIMAIALAVYLAWTHLQTNSAAPVMEARLMMADTATVEPSWIQASWVKELALGLLLIASVATLIHRVLSHYSLPIQDIAQSISSNSTEPIKVNSDIEELRSLTAGYNTIISKLKTSLSAQKRLNASMAHELKTPLAIIKTQIDVLKSQENASLTDYQETLDSIQVTLRKMNALVNTLLETSQEGSESMNEEFNLEEIVLDVIEDLTPLAKEKSITLLVETESGPKTLGNSVLMYRALYNLVENAIKYNRPEGRVRVHCEYTRDHYHLTIADSGQGIPSPDLESIFEPFYRVKGHHQDGLGLGLSLVQSVIHMHSGTIHVSSVLNQGSIFEVDLPLIPIPERKRS